MSDKRSSIIKKTGLIGTIIVDTVGYSGAGLAIGYFAWDRFGLPWWVLLISSVAGLGLAIYKLYRLSKKDFC